MDPKESQKESKFKDIPHKAERLEGARSLHESLGGDGDGHPRTWEKRTVSTDGSRRSLFFFLFY